MGEAKQRFVPDLSALRAIDLKMKEYWQVISHTQDGDYKHLIEAEIDRLADERARLLGLSEAEIARINRESEAAVEAQVRAEIEQFLSSLAGSTKR